jgi:hypothetical protein
MASVTHPNVGFPLRSSTVRVEPPRGLLGLRFGEVGAYRELFYFFVRRDVKIRYKQTAIGVLGVALQPVLAIPLSSSFGCCLSCRLSCFALSLVLSLALWIEPLNL